MSFLAMPIMIINLGGEMIYILEQRLQAQSISVEKAGKVLQDVTRAMFNAKFVEELFKPQEVYTHSSTREIYDRLAHSSIMRLSESSMDKLYDLMTMGLKYQVVSCSYPQELYHVTMNHLQNIRRIVEGSNDVLELVDLVSSRLISMYRDLDVGEYALIRQTLLGFLQDKHVKVSLFLQDSIQNNDGSIAQLPVLVLPPGAEIPGTIRYYNNMGSQIKSERFAHSGAIAGQSIGHFDYVKRESYLGNNLYSTSRIPPQQAAAAAAAANAALAASLAPLPSSRPVPLSAVSASGPVSSALPVSPKSPLPKIKGASTAELNFLADLIGTPTKKDGAGASASASDATAPNAFKLNLFPETGDDSGSSNASSSGSSTLLVVNLAQDNKASRAEANKELASLVRGMDLGSGAASGGDDDDLLDLLDSAK